MGQAISEFQLPDVVTVNRPTSVTTSGTGVETKVYTLLATDVPMYIQPARSGRLMRQDYGEDIQAVYLAFALPDQDIREGDQVVDEAGAVYRVLFVDPMRDHHLELALGRGVAGVGV